MERIQLKNKYLDVTVRIPGKEIVSQRFDAAAVVEQVVLNQKHRFCVPEQYDEKRVTTYGHGLSSEIVDGYASEAKQGELFPKMGVGLLKQTTDNGRYNKWLPYEVKPWQRSFTVGENFVEYVQKPQKCMGIALKIIRRVSIHANTLSITTTIENVGDRPYIGSEYQHNFVAIDDIPIGAGYCLKLPYDKEIKNIMTKGKAHAKNDGFRELDERGVPGKLVENPVKVDGDCIVWEGSMDRKTFHKITREDGIRTMGEYKWTLSCEQSPAKVSEVHHFVPSNFSIWGVEHCVCTEVHHAFHVSCNEKHTYTRTWIFEDDTTEDL